MKKKKEQTTTSHKVKTVIGTILCILLVPVLIINCTLIIKGLTDKESVPDVAGTFPLIVLTDSMYPEIQSGDLIICNTIDADEVKEGDVISFFDPAGNGTTIITHRVTKIIEENGEIEYKTKGDANNTADALLVSDDDLVGIYKFRIAGLGNFAMFLQKPIGMVIFILLPIIFFVTYDILRRRQITKQEHRKNEELEEELRELRKLAAQRGKNDE